MDITCNPLRQKFIILSSATGDGAGREEGNLKYFSFLYFLFSRFILRRGRVSVGVLSPSKTQEGVDSILLLNPDRRT